MFWFKLITLSNLTIPFSRVVICDRCSTCDCMPHPSLSTDLGWGPMVFRKIGDIFKVNSLKKCHEKNIFFTEICNFLWSEYYAPRDRYEGWGFDRKILQKQHLFNCVDKVSTASHRYVSGNAYPLIADLFNSNCPELQLSWQETLSAILSFVRYLLATDVFAKGQWCVPLIFSFMAA